MSAPGVILCGSLTLDNVVTAEARALPQSCGGNVVYAALGARLWRVRAGLVLRAGCDFPQDFLGRLEALGLDIGGIARVAAPHGMNVAFAYREDGGRVRALPPAIMDALPACERPRFIHYTTRGSEHRFATWLGFAPDGGDIPLLWRIARFMHCAAMPVQHHLSLAQVLRAARPEAHIQVDSPWYDDRAPTQDFHTALLGTVDLLLPSEADLAAWRPGEDPLRVAAVLAAAHRRRIVVKRGAAGCLLFDAEGRCVLEVPACKVETVDPTGVGDVFCGGVLAGLYCFGDLKRALACGTVSASFAVAGVGISRLADADPDAAEGRLRHVEQGGLEDS